MLQQQTQHVEPTMATSRRSSRGDDFDRSNRPVTEADLDELREAMQGLNERLDTLTDTMAWAMKEALQKAVAEMLQDARLFDAAVEGFGSALGRRGVQSAGNLTLGFAKDFWKWATRLGLAFVIVWQLGGWHVALDTIKDILRVAK